VAPWADDDDEIAGTQWPVPNVLIFRICRRHGNEKHSEKPDGGRQCSDNRIFDIVKL